MAGVKQRISDIVARFRAEGVQQVQTESKKVEKALGGLADVAKKSDDRLAKVGSGADKGRPALARLAAAGVGIGTGVGRGVTTATKHLATLVKKAGLATTAVGAIGGALGVAGSKRAFDDTIEDMQGVRKIAALTNSDVSQVSFLQNLGGQSGIQRDDMVGILSGFNSAATEAVRDPDSEFGKSFKDAGVQLTVTPQIDRKEFERQWKAAQVDLKNKDRRALEAEDRRLQRLRNPEGAQELTGDERQRIIDNKRIGLGADKTSDRAQRIAGEAGDADSGDVAEDVKDIEDALSDAADQSERMEAAFKAAQPPAKKLVAQFFDLATATAKMSQAQKGEFLSKIFGDDDSAKVAELLDTINANRERLGPLYRQMLESDQLITEKQVEVAKTYQRQTGVLAQAVASIKRLYFVKVAPQVGAFIDTFSKYLIENADRIASFFAKRALQLIDFAQDAVKVFTGIEIDPGKDVTFTWLYDLKRGLIDAWSWAQAFGRDVVELFSWAYDKIAASPIAQALGLKELNLETTAGIGLKGFIDAVIGGVEKVVATFVWLRDEVKATVAYVKNSWNEATQIFAGGGDLGDTTTVLSGFFLRLRELDDLVQRFGKAFKAVFVDGVGKEGVEKGFQWLVPVRDTLEAVGSMLERLGEAYKTVVRPVVEQFDALTESIFKVKGSVVALGLILLNSLSFGLLFKSLGAVLSGIMKIGKAAAGIRIGGAAAGAAAGVAGDVVGSVAGTAAGAAVGRAGAGAAAKGASGVGAEVAGAAAGAAAEGAGSKIKAAFSAAADASKKALGSVADFGKAAFGKLGEFGGKAGGAVVRASGTVATGVGTYFRHMGEVVFKVSDFLSGGFLTGAIDVTKKVGSGVADVAKAFGTTVFDAVGKAGGAVADLGGKTLRGLVDGTKSVMKPVADLASEYSGRLVDAIKGVGKENGLLKTALGGLKDGLSWLNEKFVGTTFGLLKTGVAKVIDTISGPSGLVAAFDRIPGAAKAGFDAATQALEGWLTKIGVSSAAAATGTATAVLAGGAVVGAGIGWYGAKYIDNRFLQPGRQKDAQDAFQAAYAQSAGAGALTSREIEKRALYTESVGGDVAKTVNVEAATAKVGEIDAKGAVIKTDMQPIVMPNGTTVLAPAGTDANALMRAKRLRTTG